jgi:hypothetical protein
MNLKVVRSGKKKEFIYRNNNLDSIIHYRNFNPVLIEYYRLLSYRRYGFNLEKRTNE